MVISGTKSCTGTVASLEVLKTLGDLMSPSIVFLGNMPSIIGLATLISSNHASNISFLSVGSKARAACLVEGVCNISIGF